MVPGNNKLILKSIKTQIKFPENLINPYNETSFKKCTIYYLQILFIDVELMLHFEIECNFSLIKIYYIKLLFSFHYLFF